MNSAGLSIKQIDNVEKFAWKLYENIGDIETMKSILKNDCWIDYIWDELLRTLRTASNVNEIKSMTTILKNWSKVNRLMQTFVWALYIDVAFTWIDVRMFIEQRKEAELIAKVNEVRARNKNIQAWTQLWIWVSSVFIEAMLIWGTWCSAWGPVWTLIWVAVWAIAATASIWVDALIFDVRNFYLQRKDDLIRQKKSSITEAILQWIHNQKKWNKSINEIVWSLFLESEEKIKLTESSLRSLMFLDELDTDKDFWNYVPFNEYIKKWVTKEDYLKEVTNWLSEKEAEEVRANFDEHWTKIENRIAIRIKYMREILKKDDILKALDNWNWIQMINELCAESRIYSRIHENRQWDISRESYKTNLNNYKSDLFKEFSPEKLAKFEKLRDTNRELFQEIISFANYYSLVSDDEDDKNYKENVKLIIKYQERLKLTDVNPNVVWLSVADNSKNMRFISSLIRADFNLEWISNIHWDDDDNVICIANLNYERRWTIEYSDDVWQNILYRLGKEFYGYNWENSKQWIMNYFDEWSGEVHGIYYSNGWKINNDWDFDWINVEGYMYNWKNINTIFSSEDKVKEYVKSFMQKNFRVISDTPSRTETKEKDTIDTPTEWIDENLQVEFKKVFEKILTEELMQRTKQNQDKVKNEIINFVKNYSNGNYLEIPYYLITKAKRAWLWNLERQFLKWDNNKLEMCSLPTEISNNPLWAKVNYITKARDTYTDEEKIYIDTVEDAIKNLSDLFWLGWGLGVWWSWSFESELDIPREIKSLFSDKCKEWNDFKERLLLYSPSVLAWSEIMKQYNQYIEYFENLYRWILLLLTTFAVSNDIDSYGLFQQAERFWSSNYFWEIWEIKTDLDIDFFKNNDIKSFYNEQTKKQKIKYIDNEWKETEKTIKDLRKSTETDEKEMAKRASNIIIMTIAEQWMIERGQDWKITMINKWGHRRDWDLTKWVNTRKTETERLITDRLKTIRWRIIMNMNNVEFYRQEIKTLAKEEPKILEESVNLQKIIESAAKNIERQNERWNITYDPEQKTLKSRWNGIKLEITSREKRDPFTKKIRTVIECQLDWLSEKLDIEEWLRLANFRNWVRKKYRWKTVEVDWSIQSWRYTLKVDWTRIIWRDTLNEYLPTFKSDSWREKIARWLTKQIS